ncbi:MAG TPA: sigma-70 family RNA polymerase sigma factor [Hyphomicrobiaceae bacterium]|nr:sigma-70 family RNA polymerase sigma factor [Hyphomicrobiaceae bacterium]
MRETSEELAALMRAGLQGDETAYRRALELIAQRVRGYVAYGFKAYGYRGEDVEDVVQETLLTVHLKRQTWDDTRPLEPWLKAISRNKLVDHLRRKGYRKHVPIDDFAEILAAPTNEAAEQLGSTEDLLVSLNQRDRTIVEAVSIAGHSAREVGDRLGMSEGAVRVALHRALKALAARYRGD